MRTRIFRLIVLVSLFWSAGCASIEPLLAALTPSPAPTARPSATPPPTATPTATAPAQPPVLRLWLPASFDPAAGDEAATLLGERLAEFEDEHPNLTLEVRIKTSDAETSVVDLLSVTNRAAPDALPDLILLSRSELEAAVLQGLLHPVDGLSTALEDPNWYGYAQQLAHIQNTGYGLPFAGDAQVLVYYPELGTLVSWEDVLTSEGDLVFPAGNPQALAGLSLYSSAGGEILDSQGLPTLERDALVRVLTFVQEGMSAEVFPTSLANVTTEAQALQIYRSGSANKGIIWIFNYRPLEDGAISPLPGLEEAPFSYATGWVWALAGSNPETQQLAVELAEFLVEDPFIGEWTRLTGHLPTRPSSVEGNNRTLAAVLESAQPIPSDNVLAVLGPLMQEALVRVLNGEEPEVVAESIIEQLQ
ncbi:MAG: extracellular solute-binding protein [Chloroflexota bacterium]|nr:extracellular solute-binding protein [Chloroflexota bacterium]